jgi:tetratricopeptide (TPR) repeat protein
VPSFFTFLLLVLALLALIVIRVLVMPKEEGRSTEPAKSSGEKAIGPEPTGSSAREDLLTLAKSTVQTTPDSPSAHHQLGFELYKKKEYSEAIASFTEAIRLDPEAPNSYIARALCYRRLDNLAAALEDENTARELGGPEKSAWDRIVNRSRRRWNGDFDNPDWKRTDPLSRKATLLQTLNGQILNGGLFQWVANGYGRWIDDVIEAAREVNTEASREVARSLEGITDLVDVERSRSYREMLLDQGTGGQADESSADDEAMQRIFDCEDRYYKVQSQFVEDVERWLEEKARARRGDGS